MPSSVSMVSVQAARDYDVDRVHEAIRALLEPLGGVGAFVRPGDRVLLKPNYVKSVHGDTAVVTHPAVVVAAAREVWAAGGEPFVGDSPPLDRTSRAVRKSGLLEYQEGRRLTVAEFDRKVTVHTPIPGPCSYFRFGRDPREFDAVINLGKLKAHCQVVITMSLKNTFGFVRGRSKAWLHFSQSKTDDRFARMIVQCHAAVAPTLSILDGVVALSKWGPTEGTPQPIGLLAASTDATALDRVAGEAVGVSPEDIPVLQAARAMGYGQYDRDRIEIAGPDPRDLGLPRLELCNEAVPIRFSPTHLIRGILRNFRTRLAHRP